jgi:hypothetical protein
MGIDLWTFKERGVERWSDSRTKVTAVTVWLGATPIQLKLAWLVGGTKGVVRPMPRVWQLHRRLTRCRVPGCCEAETGAYGIFVVPSQASSASERSEVGKLRNIK